MKKKIVTFLGGGGDLNLILHSNEKQGGCFSSYPYINQLETIMQDRDLIDVIPKNRRFTWNNPGGGNNIMERLDRILVNVTLFSTYSVAYASIHPFTALDHYPTSLVLETHCSLGPFSFKYSPLWNDNSAMKDSIQRSWQQHIEGSSRYIWERKIKRVKNNITSIIDRECNLQSTQGAIKQVASDHYRELLTKTKEEEDYTDLLQYLPSGINKEINDNLSKEIEEEEIRGAIWDLHPDKAPGPDGFPICFYRAHWGIIKKDFIKMVKWIQCKGKIGGYTNSTHLALIPKENCPTTFSHFRPISLCNSSYKIFTKILATRLKPLLPSLISENQGGFLANRKISDSILLVQEEIHPSHSRKEKGFILKLDLANAFDRVRHSFLIVVLKKMSFAAPLLDLIKSCITGPWISPLVNGRPGPPFQSSRGLRQGCCLSPYLFILMVESFSKALDYKR
eukprot:PITA_06593